MIYCLFFLLGLIFSAQLVADEAKVPASLQQFEQQLQRIGNAKADCVVVIAAVSTPEEQRTPSAKFSSLFNPAASRLPARLGMGVIVEKSNEQLLILTTSHLVEPMTRRGQQSQSSELLVKFSSNQVHLAKVVAADPRSELAILQVVIDAKRESDQQVNAIEFSANQSLAKGSILVAIGNPREMARDGSASLTTGVVANTGRSIAINSQIPLSERTLHDLGTLIEIDLPQRFTISGTALVTTDGQFAGLIRSQSLPLENGDTVSYAVPMSPGFIRIIEELKQGFEVEYGFLGVSSETSQSDALDGISLADPQATGALVIRVPDNSPADKAGLKREDIILRVNSHKVETSEDLVREIGLLKPEEKVEIILFRHGEGIKSVTVQLGKWPIYDDTFLFTTRERYPAWRGIQVDYATGRRRYLRDRFLAVFPGGVAISSVTSESIADLAGLQIGQLIVKVNDRPVETPQQFHAAIEKSDGDVLLTLANGAEAIIPAK